MHFERPENRQENKRRNQKKKPDMSIFHSPWNRYQNRRSMSSDVLTTGSRRTIGCKNRDVSYYKELIRMLE